MIDHLSNATYAMFCNDSSITDFELLLHDINERIPEIQVIISTGEKRTIVKISFP